MKKVFRQLHLWMSVPFGLIIAVICFSGAALVFENEVMELCRHDLYYVKKVEAVPLPMDELMTKVTATLPDSVAVTGVTVSSDPERAWQVNLSKPRRASMYIDQYTGEIKGKSERAPFFLTMFKLHRWLLDSMKPDGGIFWGKMIVGTGTLMLVFVLISGIVIWWPRTKKALKNSLKIAADKGWRRFWYDLHIAGGLYTLVFLLLMALTGLTWSFSWYRTGFYKTFGVEMPQGGGGHGASAKVAQGEEISERSKSQEQGHRERKGEASNDKRGREEGAGSSEENRTNSEENRTRNSEGRSEAFAREGRGEGHHNPFAGWQQVCDELKALNPEYKQITVSKGSASVSFNRLGNQRASDRYTFNPRNGKITETTLYKDMDASGKIRGWIFSVHVGSWGGMFTRILTFIAALLGATLPLTGYYLWLKRLNRKGRATPVVNGIPTT